MALSRARHGGNDALLDALDQGLKRLAKDGSLRRIEQRYVEGLPR
jgi:ABC-type amino acid transport substrate-binding protein